MIYQYTGHFPKSETFGMSNQMRRAAISVISNIAEAAGRSNPKEKRQFYRIAYASLMELLSQLIVSADLCFIDHQTLSFEIRPLVMRISSKLYTLKNKSLPQTS